jgi:hypothetical protein
MSFTYTKYFNHNKIYNILSSITDKGIEADSPTQHGSHICTQVGCRHDGYLLRHSPHLSLVVDLVAGEPNV